MSVIVDVSNAVVAALNDGPPFSRAFTAARKYLPTVDLSDGDALTVLVAARSVSVSPHSRDKDGIEVNVDVGVLENVSSIDDNHEELDGLVGLVEEIVDRLRANNLSVGSPSTSVALFKGVVNDPIYARDHLRERRQFTSIVTVSYILFRIRGS